MALTSRLKTSDLNGWQWGLEGRWRGRGTAAFLAFASELGHMVAINRTDRREACEIKETT